MNKLNIVLFGPPGAGKGTQSELIIKEFNLTHISTGDLFRKHIGEGTELGKEAQRYMDEGELVPDQLVIDMVEAKLSENHTTTGFIFDGFPRTVNQAEALDKLLDRVSNPIAVTIALEVPEEELKRRLLERGKTSGRPDDQNEEKVNTRISVYLAETLPVATYYKEQSKFSSVDGIGSIEDIFARISQAIASHSTI